MIGNMSKPVPVRLQIIQHQGAKPSRHVIKVRVCCSCVMPVSLL